MGTENVIMDAKTVDWYARVPVAVHMWFADGAGWAYHPAISDNVLEEVIRTVTPVLYSSESESRVTGKCPAGLLVVEKLPQENCDDPSAIARSPHVVRVAVLNQPVWDECFTPEEAENDRLCDDLFRQFGRISYPTKRGPCESLVVWAKAAPAPANSATPEVVDEPTVSPQHAHVDELTIEISLLKQETTDLRRQNEYLRKNIPTRRQRLVNTVAIVLVTALLTAAAIYVVLVISGLP